jgi:hypothetical protein
MSRTCTPHTSLLTLRTDPLDKLVSKTRLVTTRIEIEIVYNMYRVKPADVSGPSVLCM